jgi:hypothetical protein
MKLRQLTWDPDAVEALRPALERSATAGLSGPIDELRNAHLWEYREDGAVVLLAVRGVQLQYGRWLDVIAGHSSGERVSSARFCEALDHLGRNFYAADVLTTCTGHAHLQRGYLRNGWQNSGAVMKKRLGVQ